MEAPALLRDLAAGRVPRLLLIHGSEPLLVDELLERLAAAVLADPASAAWNREVLYADAATPDAVVSAGLALPLFGGRRLVLVRGIGQVPAKAIERLRSAIDGARRGPGGWPAEGTTLVFVAGELDRRGAALRLAGEGIEALEVRPPSGRAVVGWLRERARAVGLDLAPQAAEALIALVGEDLGRLASELEKAALFAGDDRRVTEEVVRALAGESRVRQYWELTQALEEGDRARALSVLDRLLLAGEEPTVLVARIAEHARDLWRVQAGLAARRDARQIATLLPRRRPPFAVERLMARAEAVRPDGVSAALRRCFEADRRLKSGGGEARALLTALVADLAGA